MRMYTHLFKKACTSNGAAAALAAAMVAGASTAETPTTQCQHRDDKKSSVVGMLHNLDARLGNIEKTLGVSSGGGAASVGAGVEDGYRNDAVGKTRTLPGIDVVLGSQWGDEGKGKLVDLLSQVSL